MKKFDLRLLAGTAFAAFALSVGQAHAGAFGIHEQSAEGLGVSFAGVAAGGAPSSMFWNPATMTQMRGIAAESDLTGIFPNSKIYTGPAPGSSFGAGSPLAPLFPDPQNNIGTQSFVPATYMIMQVRPDIWLGLSVNGPFGLTTGFPINWPGRQYGLESTLSTYNATPSIAYKVNNWLSLGAGVQAQYATTNLNFGLPAPVVNASMLNLSGSGWGFGFTAGATVTPWVGTELGLGYRSFINQPIGGTLTIPALPFSTPGAISSTVKLPDIVNAGIRQRVNDSFTLLGTVEWTNWSRIGTSQVISGNGGPALVAGVPVQLPFQFRNGWLFSGGAEYRPIPGWVLRAGAGYEISPVSDQVRIPVLPDNNRIWLSAGVTKAIIPGLYLDFSYAHLFVQNAPITITAASGNPWFNPAGGVGNYTGTASTQIDIISVGLRLQAPPIPPTAPIITKG